MYSDYATHCQDGRPAGRARRARPRLLPRDPLRQGHRQRGHVQQADVGGGEAQPEDLEGAVQVEIPDPAPIYRQRRGRRLAREVRPSRNPL